MIKMRFTVVNLFRILSLSAAFLLPQFARADGPAPSGQVLGITEALLGYCSKVDPAAANKYQERISLLVRGADEEKVAEVRKSDEYKQAYDSMTEFVGKVADENAKRTCSEYLTLNR